LRPSFEGGRQPRQRNLICLLDEVANALSACAQSLIPYGPAESQQAFRVKGVMRGQRECLLNLRIKNQIKNQESNIK